MSTFEVKVERVLNVEDHPNADRLSLVTIRGYRCISAKLSDGSPRYKIGDRVVYVPEDAIVPEFLLRKGFWNTKEDKGGLAGANGDRVKAIRLRDMLSQGILYSVDMFDGFDPENHFVLTHSFPDEYEIGDNVAELLGITKYVPEIPMGMNGEVAYIGTSNVVKFDIENIKAYPEVIPVGTPVVYEEKLHGTCFVSGIVPALDHEDLIKGDMFVSSKGMAAKGIVLKNNADNRERNVYVRAFHEHKIGDLLEYLSAKRFNNQPVYVLGEVYGRGVQDLTYSLTTKKFAAFGIFVGYPQEGRWLNAEEKYEILAEAGVETPPVLYKGPHDLAKLAELSQGTSALDNVTVREGVVVTPAIEDRHVEIGRVILKSISEAYLLRKGNTTEFQ